MEAYAVDFKKTRLYHGLLQSNNIAQHISHCTLVNINKYVRM